MNKILLTLLLSAAGLTSASHAVTTISFGSASGFLTGLANSSGQTNQTLVWGILVDTAGNGLSLNYAASSVKYSDTASTPQGQFLVNFGTGLATDDLLFISTNLMTTGSSGDNSSGLAKPTNLLLSYTGESGTTGVDGVGGQDFWIIWFDATTKTGQQAQNNDAYGVYRISAFDVPANALGGSVSFAANFTGPDPANIANLRLLPVPEPSSVLLGLLGAAALLRRRR